MQVRFKKRDGRGLSSCGKWEKGGKMGRIGIVAFTIRLALSGGTGVGGTGVGGTGVSPVRARTGETPVPPGSTNTSPTGSSRSSCHAAERDGYFSLSCGLI